MYQKRRVTEMEVRPNTYREIMKKKSRTFMTNAQFRSMLVSLKPGCHVETEDARGGKVVQVERDRNDIPISVRTECPLVDRDDNVLDIISEWISVDDIVFWEAWDFIAPEYLFDEDNAPIGEIMFESEVT